MPCVRPLEWKRYPANALMLYAAKEMTVSHKEQGEYGWSCAATERDEDVWSVHSPNFLLVPVCVSVGLVVGSALLASKGWLAGASVAFGCAYMISVATFSHWLEEYRGQPQ